MTTSQLTPEQQAVARFNMIEQQIRPWNVSHGPLLEQLGIIRREQFLPDTLQSLAFADLSLPLIKGVPSAVMLPPKIQARMVQDAALSAGERALEIGTGTGYTAALMSQFCDQVVSLEIQDTLAKQAIENLHQAQCFNVQVHTVDAFAKDTDLISYAESGRHWDVILLSGLVPEVPAAFLESLAPQGRLIAMVGEGHLQRCTRITRVKTGFETVVLWDGHAPAFENGPQAQAFVF